MRLNGKSFAKLMFAALLVSSVSPALSASEINSNVQSDTVSSEEQVSQTTSDVKTGEVVTSESDETTSDKEEVIKDETTSDKEEVNKDETTSDKEEVNKDETTSDKEEVNKDETTSDKEEVNKDETTSDKEEVNKDETTSDKEEADTKATVGSDFDITASAKYTDLTALNQESTAKVSLYVDSDNQIKSGATVKLSDSDAFTFSKLSVENYEGKLVEGTDYKFDGTTVTFLRDIDAGEDIEINFTYKIVSGATDVLGALDKAIYIDKNNNGKFDGTDYNVSEPGFMVTATNGKKVIKDPAYVYADIDGGSFTAKETKMTRSYKDGKISGTIDYNISNTGKYAIELRTLYTDFDIVLNDTGAKLINSKYYNSGDRFVLPTTKISISVGGGDYLTLEHYLDRVTSTKQEYFNPGETVKLRAHFSLSKDETKYALSKDGFGSWKNFTNGNNGLLTITQEYGDNVFDGDLHSAKDVTVSTSLKAKAASKPVEDDKDTTTVTKPAEKETKPAKKETTETKPAKKETTETKPAEKATTETKPAEKATKTEDNFVKMTTDNKSTEKESKTELANTGSTLVMITGLFAVILAALVSVKRYVK